MYRNVDIYSISTKHFIYKGLVLKYLELAS